ncbi:MAG: MFS transporter [Actinomycetota bacterium]
MTGTAEPDAAELNDDGKWLAFSAIGIAFVTNVAAWGMVFVSLPSIAEDFGISLRSVAWVVIAQSLVISSLMLPMGRVADMTGRRRMHLTGLTLFGVGAASVALAPGFGLVIAARVIMAVGNAMMQSVGTAMVVAVFPDEERGKAIGSQTTAVAVGGASGPILGGLILQVLPWRALFVLLLLPVCVALVFGYLVLDEEKVSPVGDRREVGFDWGGAALSGLMVIILVLTINNPVGLPWGSPFILGGLIASAGLFAAWVRWELHTEQPMLELRLFRNRVFSFAVGARYVGFMGGTFVSFLAPVLLISLRQMEAAAAGGVMFLNAVGLGVAAQISGRLSDRFGSRPFSAAGFVLHLTVALVLSTAAESTPLVVVMLLMFGAGLSVGLWNVPNNSTIMGSMPPSRHGVIGAFTNLVRNLGNVTGQALASAVVVGVMVSRGFDIPLDEISESAAAGDAFLGGWRWTFRISAALALAGLVLTVVAPSPSERRVEPSAGEEDSVAEKSPATEGDPAVEERPVADGSMRSGPVTP